MAEGAFNPETFGLGFRVSGTDEDGDVEQIGFIFQGTAEPMEPIEVPFSNYGSIEFTEIQFTGEIAAFGDESFMGATSALVYVIDSRGLESEQVEVMLNPPNYLNVDDACSTTDGFNVCGSDTECGVTGEETDGVCVTPVKPVLTDGEAFYNGETFVVGVRANGTDATVAGFYVNQMEITLYDEAGADLFGESFVFSADTRTSGEAPAFSAITVVGYPEDMAPPATLQISVLSSVGEQSDPITLTVNTMIPTVAETEYCDGSGGIAQCEEDVYCADFACTSAENLLSECPEDYTVNVLTLETSVTGDNSTSEVTGGGTCGGGGPVDVYSFTAVEAGNYTFTLTAEDPETVDPLLFVREYCRYNNAEFELACNDDIDGEARNYNSSLSVTLEAGQTVYVFADSYNGSFPGAYELSVSN
jgi:hypothetical protein